MAGQLFTPRDRIRNAAGTMKKHDWRETTLDDETQMFRATVHANRWEFYTKMKGDEPWQRQDPPTLHQLTAIRDIIWNKYQRGRTAWKAVEQLDKMVEAAGGKPIRPADEKG
jgi:hypothetical protein